jgi:hypothetical protein
MTHYRQEIIRVPSEVVDYVSRVGRPDSIPVPEFLEYEDILQARKILDNTEWEVVAVDSDWMYFRRYIENDKS